MMNDEISNNQTMTNDEIRMTKQIQRSPRISVRSVLVSSFVIRISSLFRYSRFRYSLFPFSYLLAAARRDEFSCVSAHKTRPFGPPLKKIGIALLIANSWARAGTITIQIPADLQVEKAIATTEKEPKANLAGSIDHDSITFADPTPGLAYEAKLTLKNGTILRGVDMNWYSRVPDKANAEALTDDDRQQMTAVFSAGAQFFNVQECTLLKGNHNRAVMLVRCERNSKFHSDKGDEVIWRPELWYFQNEHGGWEKVLQTDRVMERERFATQAEYHAVVDKWKWVPELGGLKVTPKTPDLKVTLPPNAGVAAIPAAVPPSTQPAAAPRP